MGPSDAVRASCKSSGDAGQEPYNEVPPDGAAGGDVAQLARAPALHAGGREFESPRLHSHFVSRRCWSRPFRWLRADGKRTGSAGRPAIASHPSRTVRTVKPKALMGRLLGGTFTDVSFVDARRLMGPSGSRSCASRGAITFTDGRVSPNSSTCRFAAVRPSPTSSVSSLRSFGSTISESRTTSDRPRLPDHRVLEPRGQRMGGRRPRPSVLLGYG